MIEESDSDDSDAGNDSANEDDMKERNPRKDRNRDRHDRDKTEKVIGLDLILGSLVFLIVPPYFNEVLLSSLTILKIFLTIFNLSFNFKVLTCSYVRPIGLEAVCLQ